MKRLSMDPQIKRAHSGYWDQAIRIMRIQQKSSSSGYKLKQLGIESMEQNQIFKPQYL